MFTKNDYVQYFEQLAEKERSIVFNLKEIIARITDKNLSGIFNTMLKEQLGNYDIVVDLVDRIIKPTFDGRRNKRLRALGEATLINAATGERFTSRCLDISLGGLCVQLSKPLAQGQLFDVEATFFKSEKKLARRAKVMWCRLAGLTQHRAGLQFEEPSAK